MATLGYLATYWLGSVCFHFWQKITPSTYPYLFASNNGTILTEYKANKANNDSLKVYEQKSSSVVSLN